MTFRRFNDQGVKEFAKYLDELRTTPDAPVPTDLLTNPRMTEPLSVLIEADPPASFASRMEFAKWLHAAAAASGVAIPREDAGFWAWLSLALFDHVCPADAKGKRRVKEYARYLPELGSRHRYYRHCLLGPFYVYWIYRTEPETAAVVLCGSLSKLTDEAYRLSVENGLVVMRSAMSVLTRLYYDELACKLKQGCQTSKRGSIRRLVKYLTRYARTHDLDEIPVERLVAILPAEFNRWRNEAALNTITFGRQ